MNRPLIRWPDAQFKDTLTFYRAIRAAPSRIAAIAPSGAALARLITSELGSHSGPIIELGPGTGVFTQALIGQGVRERDLTLVEYYPEFVQLLRRRFPEARVLHMDASRLHRNSLLSQDSVGAVVSGLPLLSIPPAKVLAILRGAFRCMQPGGAFYQFTYSPLCPVRKPCLEHLGLRASCLGRVLNNFPPASVFRITQSA